MDFFCLNIIYLLLIGILIGFVNNKKLYYIFIYKYNMIFLYDKYI